MILKRKPRNIETKRMKIQPYNTALNFFIDDALETIDRIRGPLAQKRLEGKQFSESEFVNLEILNSLTNKILSLLTPEPEEPTEVRLAVEYAKRIGR